MAELNGELLGYNIAKALEDWNVANTDENVEIVLNHLYNQLTDNGFIYDEVRWLCENDKLQEEK